MYIYIDIYLERERVKETQNPSDHVLQCNPIASKTRHTKAEAPALGGADPAQLHRSSS